MGGLLYRKSARLTQGRMYKAAGRDQPSSASAPIGAAPIKWAFLLYFATREEKDNQVSGTTGQVGFPITHKKRTEAAGAPSGALSELSRKKLIRERG